MDSRSPRALIDTPPVWLVACIALAWLQARWLTLWLTPAFVDAAGYALIALSVVLFVAAVREFRRHRTSIVPRETPAALLTSGPYALSRNPIYLADAALLCGLVLVWDAGALPLVAAFVAVIQTRFILWEEQECRATFGTDWQIYTTRVRRWF